MCKTHAIHAICCVMLQMRFVAPKIYAMCSIDGVAEMLASKNKTPLLCINREGRHWEEVGDRRNVAFEGERGG